MVQKSGDHQLGCMKPYKIMGYSANINSLNLAGFLNHQEYESKNSSEALESQLGACQHVLPQRVPWKFHESLFLLLLNGCKNFPSMDETINMKHPLGGGNSNICSVSPQALGKMIQFDLRIFFSSGWNPPTSFWVLDFFHSPWKLAFCIGKSVRLIGSTSSNGRFFQCHLSFRGCTSLRFVNLRIRIAWKLKDLILGCSVGS